MWSARKPYHWQTDGMQVVRNDVSPFSVEAMAIANYFYEAMPENTELRRIERWESRQLYLPYDSYRETVRAKLEWKLEQLESWLFHGTDKIDDILQSGFSSAHVNLKSNKYGAGIYFARDPRLAHFFLRELRGQSEAEFKILLCRVVVGWCQPKAAVRKKDLELPEHRKPADGYQSATSRDMPGREIVVFPGHPSTPAYPAYILTYTTPLQSNPYRDNMQLLRMDFINRGDSHVFDRYRLQYRPHWRLIQHGSDSQDNPQEDSQTSVASRSPSQAAVDIACISQAVGSRVVLNAGPPNLSSSPTKSTICQAAQSSDASCSTQSLSVGRESITTLRLNGADAQPISALMGPSRSRSPRRSGASQGTDASLFSKGLLVPPPPPLLSPLASCTSAPPLNGANPQFNEHGLDQFTEVLQELDSDAQSKIKQLTAMAKVNKEQSNRLAIILRQEVLNAQARRIRPLIYVVDSIIKGLGKEPRMHLITLLPDMLGSAVSKADPALHGFLQKIVSESWKKHDLLPPDISLRLDAVLASAPPASQGQVEMEPSPAQSSGLPAPTPTGQPPVSVGACSPPMKGPPKLPMKMEVSAEPPAARVSREVLARSPLEEGLTVEQVFDFERRLDILTKIIDRTRPSQEELREFMRLPEVVEAMAMQRQGKKTEAMNLLFAFKAELEKNVESNKLIGKYGARPADSRHRPIRSRSPRRSGFSQVTEASFFPRLPLVRDSPSHSLDHDKEPKVICSSGQGSKNLSNATSSTSHSPVIQQEMSNPEEILADMPFPKSIQEWHVVQDSVFAGHDPLPDGWIRAWSRSRKCVYYVRMSDNRSVFNVESIPR